MNKINYFLVSGILMSVALSAGASSVIPVEYKLMDSAADPTDVQVDARIRAADLDRDGMVDVQTSVGGRAELEQFNSAERVLPTVNKKTVDGSTERLLPTVNKKTIDASAERVLPTVNKRVAKVTVRGWDAEKKEEVANMEKNIKAATDADENIASIEIRPEKIEMTYRRPAKLFGFIPVAYYHAFTVDDKGNVAQGHPWWLALAKDDADNFGSDVKYIFQRNQSDLRFIKAPTIIEWQTQRLSALSDVMKTRHDTAMNAIRNMK